MCLQRAAAAASTAIAVQDRWRPAAWVAPPRADDDDAAAAGGASLSLQQPPQLEEGLREALRTAVETANAREAASPEATKRKAESVETTDARRAMSRTQAMHQVQREALEREAVATRNAERRAEFEAREEEWLSRLEAEQDRLAAQLRQARAETAAAQRKFAEGVAAKQQAQVQGEAGAGEVEAQWVETLVQVQAAEAATHERQVRHTGLDRSLVNSGKGEELLAHKEALRDLRRVIDKSKLGQRMSIAGLEAK